MIVIGPKQVILTNAGGATAATHIIGASDNVLTGSKGLPIRDTFGAIGIQFRAWSTIPGVAGTLVLATPYVSWPGTFVATALIPVQTLPVVTTPASAVDMTAGGYVTAQLALAMSYFFTDPAGTLGIVPCTLPNLHARITVGGNTIAGLTIEAAVIKMDAPMRYDLNLQTPNGNTVLAQPFAW